MSLYCYREISIKNLEREKRGPKMGNTYRSIHPEYRVQKWRLFLSNTENKQRVIHSIVTEWQKERYSVKLAVKELYATVAEERYKITSDRSELFKELGSTQEEVDTRLLLHVYHAGRNGFTTVVISSDNIDVFVLALTFKSSIPSSVYNLLSVDYRPKQGILTSCVLSSTMVQRCADIFLGHVILEDKRFIYIYFVSVSM